MTVKPKAELLDELESLCKATPAEQRDSNERIKALRDELLDRRLNDKEMGRLKGLEATYNLA